MEKKIPATDLFVFVGAYDAVKDGLPHIASHWTEMPGYKKLDYGPYPNELAIIYLKLQIILDEQRKITIIPMNPLNFKQGTIYQNAGWGFFNGQLSPVLRKAEFEALTNEECQKRSPFHILRPEQMCFGGKNAAMAKKGFRKWICCKWKAINIAGTGKAGSINIAVNLLNNDVRKYIGADKDAE